MINDIGVRLDVLRPDHEATRRVIEHNPRSVEEQAQAIIARAFEYAAARLTDDVAAAQMRVS